MQTDVKLVRSQSPFITKKWNSRRIMLDVLIALIPVVVFTIYRWGFASFCRMFTSVLVAMLTEFLIFPLSQKPDRKAEGKWQRLVSRYKDFNSLNLLTSALTGLIFVLTLPAGISFYVIVMGAIFGIAIGKMVFGGTGHNVFNPAAVGRVFVSLAFGSFFVGAYPSLDVVAGTTPLTYIRQESFAKVLESYEMWELFVGCVPGPMGEISKVAILLGAVYLIIRKAADWKIMLAVVVPSFIFALIAGLGLNVNAFQFALFHLLSGGLLFGAVFMATDPVSSPLHTTTKLLYGLIIAIVTMLNRFFGSMPEGVVFGILFANMFVPLFDRIKIFKNRFNWQFLVTYGVSMIVMILIIFFGKGGTF
ncbi:MAG: RnfABCDGE type electron transport complex subunit D [Acholeplasmataceae bacterium]|jgi:electron transport complex protein RnfD|nr:RnfABCDGE type electron transport complex subunit D [Acholeplasmataceae bacterium]